MNGQHAHVQAPKQSCVPFYMFEHFDDLANTLPEWRPQLENCSLTAAFSSPYALLSPYAALLQLIGLADRCRTTMLHKAHAVLFPAFGYGSIRSCYQLTDIKVHAE